MVAGQTSSLEVVGSVLGNVRFVPFPDEMLRSEAIAAFTDVDPTAQPSAA